VVLVEATCKEFLNTLRVKYNSSNIKKILLEVMIGILVGATQVFFLASNFRDEKFKLRPLLQPPMLQLEIIFFGGSILFLVCMVIFLVFLLQGFTWKALIGNVNNAAEFKDKAKRANLESNLLLGRRQAYQ
jgi:hypothetical protein